MIRAAPAIKSKLTHRLSSHDSTGLADNLHRFPLKGVGDFTCFRIDWGLGTDQSHLCVACQVCDQVAHFIALPKADELILEVGGGTGSVTQSLLDRGIPAENIIVIERSPSLANHLKQRFPAVHIIEGDATELPTLLGDKGKRVVTVVSSLPLRSFPKETVLKFNKALNWVIQPGGQFIQFTYQLVGQPSPVISRLKCQRTQRVWRNIPPARIEIFQSE